MDVKSIRNPERYKGTLQFWKSLEEKYRRKKLQWLKEAEKMRAERAEIDRLRKELQEIRTAHSEENATAKEPVEELKDPEEFSDVDRDVFIDPGDRYYSSLDVSAWQKIQNDLTLLLRPAVTEMERRRQRTITSILVLTMLGFGLILLYMRYVSGQVIPEVAPPPPCSIPCDTPTFLELMFAPMFPSLGAQRPC